MSKIRAMAVVGATASGKSMLALELAKRMNGELICMDSMQVYRRMDIGTAKPTVRERELAPHHLLDIVEPTETFAVAEYERQASDVIAQIAARNRTPILVGGTGLYLKALMHGMALGGVGSDEHIRVKYAAMSEESGGRERLHGMLAKVDAVTAARLHPNDLRRVIRALEIYELTGAPMSIQRQPQGDGRFRILPIGLRMPKDILNERIQKRVFQMLEIGLMDEIRALLDSGVLPDAQAMQGIGYKELIPVVLNGLPQSEAVWQVILNTRHYAKRQGTWFNAEPAVQWVEALSPHAIDEAQSAADAFLGAHE